MATLDLIRHSRTLHSLLLRHDRDSFEDPRDQNIVDAVAPLLAHDPFSLSQYALGLTYARAYLARLGLPHTSVLLDLGCGAGNWGLAAASDCNIVVGVDVRADRLRVAAHAARFLGIETRVHFVHGSASTLPLPTSSVDTCICINAFVFFPDHLQAAHEIRRVLRKGGVVYLSIPRAGHVAYLLHQAAMEKSIVSASRLVKQLVASAARACSRNPGCLAYASPKTMCSLASAARFRVQAWGTEGSLGQSRVASLFPSTYGGLPFMSEYLWVAE